MTQGGGNKVVATYLKRRGEFDNLKKFAEPQVQTEIVQSLTTFIQVILNDMKEAGEEVEVVRVSAAENSKHHKEAFESPESHEVRRLKDNIVRLQSNGIENGESSRKRKRSHTDAANKEAELRDFVSLAKRNISDGTTIMRRLHELETGVEDSDAGGASPSKTKLQECEKQTKKLQDKIDELTNQLNIGANSAGHRAEDSVLRAENQDLEEQLVDCQDQREEQETQLNAQIIELNKRVAALRKQLISYQEIKRDRDAQIADLNDQISQLRRPADVEELQSQVTELEKTVQELTDRLAECKCILYLKV